MIVSNTTMVDHSIRWVGLDGIASSLSPWLYAQGPAHEQRKKQNEQTNKQTNSRDNNLKAPAVLWSWKELGDSAVQWTSPEHPVWKEDGGPHYLYIVALVQQGCGLPSTINHSRGNTSELCEETTASRRVARSDDDNNETSIRVRRLRTTESLAESPIWWNRMTCLSSGPS